jgi:hypothetical protein
MGIGYRGKYVYYQVLTVESSRVMSSRIENE